MLFQTVINHCVPWRSFLSADKEHPHSFKNSGYAIFFLLHLFVLCACMREPGDAKFCLWRSGDNLQETNFSFHHMSSGEQTQVIRSGCKHPYPLICLTGPGSLFSTCAILKIVPTRWALGLIVGILECITLHRVFSYLYRLICRINSQDRNYSVKGAGSIFYFRYIY